MKKASYLPRYLFPNNANAWMWRHLQMKKSKKILIVLVTLILIFLIIFFIPESGKEIKTQHFTFLFSRSIDRAKINELANALESNYLTSFECIKLFYN